MATPSPASSPPPAPAPPRIVPPKTPMRRPHCGPVEPNSRSQLRGEWVRFLSRYRWALVLTLTFGQDRRAVRAGQNPEFADKAFRRLIRHINDILHGRRWMAKSPNGGVVWARVHELQRDGTSHYHAVIFSPAIPNMSMLISETRAWWRANYGTAAIETPNCNSSVLHYLVKHVGDPNAGEVDISHNFGRCG